MGIVGRYLAAEESREAAPLWTLVLVATNILPEIFWIILQQHLLITANCKATGMKAIKINMTIRYSKFGAFDFATRISTAHVPYRSVVGTVPVIYRSNSSDRTKALVGTGIQ